MPLSVEPTLVFISALRIKALLILAASLFWIEDLVICPMLMTQGFLPNSGQQVWGKLLLETVITCVLGVRTGRCYPNWLPS